LPVPYFHIVFTLPAPIAAIALQNKAVVYDILFKTAAETIRTIGADPKHLGAETGMIAILHTWGQTLTHHPHVHCLVPGGGLASDGRWVACRPGFFLPVRVLSRLYRRLFLDRLQAAFDTGDLKFVGALAPLAEPAGFAGHLKSMRGLEWVVYAKRPFLPDRRRSSTISAATPIASPSPTAVFSTAPMGASASAGRSYGEVDSSRRSGRVAVAKPPTLETTMPSVADRTEAPTTIRTDLAAIFISLELSRSIWLVTSVSPGSGEKMSKHSVRAGDVAALLARFSELKHKALARTGKSFAIVAIQEAGLDGFWLHRALEQEGIESHVVDPASIATSRRRRRAKTDRIDGEALLRALLAYKRGEPRVCTMVRAPTPEDEDRRRLCRERKTLIAERVEHVNRIKGLLFSQGISSYEPLRRDRRQRLEDLRTGDGRSLPTHLKTQISRELDRLELLLDQIKLAEAERDALLAEDQAAAPEPPGRMLLEFKGIGAEFAATLWLEGLFRRFDNRRQLASYAGLAPTPWQSGSVDREQGVSKAGNPRLRAILIELAWLWLRHQPQSALALWFKERVKRNGGRMKKTTIVALARKLLVALWKYVTAGVLIEGAVMKVA